MEGCRCDRSSQAICLHPYPGCIAQGKVCLISYDPTPIKCHMAFLQ